MTIYLVELWKTDAGTRLTGPDAFTVRTGRQSLVDDILSDDIHAEGIARILEIADDLVMRDVTQDIAAEIWSATPMEDIGYSLLSFLQDQGAVPLNTEPAE